MILGLDVSKAMSFTLDEKKDTNGFCIDLQIWRLVLSFWISWAGK